MISFIDVFFNVTTARHVLCIVPINTLQNWLAEFDLWLPPKKDENEISGERIDDVKFRTFKVFALHDAKSILNRTKEIANWQNEGGVLLLGYEMYRILTATNLNIKRSKEEASIDPQQMSRVRFNL